MKQKNLKEADEAEKKYEDVLHQILTAFLNTTYSEVTVEQVPFRFFLEYECDGLGEVGSVRGVLLNWHFLRQPPDVYNSSWLDQQLFVLIHKSYFFLLFNAVQWQHSTGDMPEKGETQ